MPKVSVGVALIGAVVGAAVAAACGLDTAGSGPVAAGLVDPGGDANAGINTTGVGAGTGAETGLPCDVQQLLENRCIGCHLGPSPPSLLTYADLMKPSSEPTKNLAQKALERMQSTAAPMPPPPVVAPTAAEIATFQAWVTAGTPKSSACTPAVPPPTSPTVNPIYNTPLVCTSKTTWPGGDESASMRPGRACITCHTVQGGPAFTVAGTVYPTAHEPDNCVGVAGGLTVVVTDATGTVTNIPVNQVGNFSYTARIAPPFHVQVTDGTKVRAMTMTLTAGDCNSCHTVTGANGAPGRIMAP